MSRIQSFILSLCALLCLGTGVVLTMAPAAPSSAAGLDRKATVRLYSAGNVVGVWEARGPGVMEGDSYVFTVQQGSQRSEVRVSGTFSVEEKR